jgi:hypothetical protein
MSTREEFSAGMAKPNESKTDIILFLVNRKKLRIPIEEIRDVLEGKKDHAIIRFTKQ